MSVWQLFLSVVLFWSYTLVNKLSLYVSNICPLLPNRSCPLVWVVVYFEGRRVNLPVNNSALVLKDIFCAIYWALSTIVKRYFLIVSCLINIIWSSRRKIAFVKGIIVAKSWSPPRRNVSHLWCRAMIKFRAYAQLFDRRFHLFRTWWPMLRCKNSVPWVVAWRDVSSSRHN